MKSENLKKLSLILLLSSANSLVSSALGQSPPNIIYLFTDQQTASAMSCVGNLDIKTPNMDKLASEGVRFANAYCAAPLCSPSRASMFTGVMPHQAGVMENGLPIAEEYKNKTLGYLLSEDAYECAYGGKWHLPNATIDPSQGFEKIHDFGDTGLAESAVEWLRKKHSKPFFLVVSFDNPHNICQYARKQPLPWATVQEPPIADCPNLPANFTPAPYEADQIRDEQGKDFNLYPVKEYSPDDWRRYRNAYFRLVEQVDREIGKILAEVEKQKLNENTIIIFSSDHGDGTGAHQWNQKSVLFEEVVNIPLIIQLPGNKNHSVATQIVDNGPDLYATICDIAGLRLPDHAVGKSLLPLVIGSEKNEIHKFIVTESKFDRSAALAWMVRTPGYKYVLYQAGRYREQLFDMKSDPKEQVNLAVQSNYERILDQHRNYLSDWAKKTDSRITLRYIPE